MPRRLEAGISLAPHVGGDRSLASPDPFFTPAKGALEPMHATRQASTRPSHIAALLMPADETLSCRLLAVEESSVEISAAIGGGTIDDVVTGASPGGLFVVYAQDETGLPENARAGILAAQLGYHARDVLRRLRGDILVTGMEPGGRWDVDIPSHVLAALRAAGIPVDTTAILTSAVLRGRPRH